MANRSAPIQRPTTVVFFEDDTDRYRNQCILFPEDMANEDPEYDPHDGPVAEGDVLARFPAANDYSFAESVPVSFRDHDFLLDMIDAVGAEYALTRSDTIRRLLRAGIALLEGKFEEVKEQLELPNVGAQPLRPAQAQRQKTPGQRPASLGPAEQNTRSAA